jgi:hypothetical protein
MTTRILLKSFAYSPESSFFPAEDQNVDPRFRHLMMKNPGKRINVTTIYLACVGISKSLTACIAPRFSSNSKHMDIHFAKIFTTFSPSTFRFTRVLKLSAPIYTPETLQKTCELLMLVAPFLFQIHDLDLSCAGEIKHKSLFPFVNMLPNSAKATLEHLNISYAHFQDYSRNGQKNNNKKSGTVTIESAPNEIEDLICANFKNIKTLNCYRVTDIGKGSLAAINKNLRKIEFVNFSHNDYFIGIDSLTALLSPTVDAQPGFAAKSLKSLIVEECSDIDDECCTLIAKSCVSLIEISLFDCQHDKLTSAGIATLVDPAVSVFAHQLETLCFGYCCSKGFDNAIDFFDFLCMAQGVDSRSPSSTTTTKIQRTTFVPTTCLKKLQLTPTMAFSGWEKEKLDVFNAFKKFLRTFDSSMKILDLRYTKEMSKLMLQEICKNAPNLTNIFLNKYEPDYKNTPSFFIGKTECY